MKLQEIVMNSSYINFSGYLIRFFRSIYNLLNKQQTFTRTKWNSSPSFPLPQLSLKVPDWHTKSQSRPLSLYKPLSKWQSLSNHASNIKLTAKPLHRSTQPPWTSWHLGSSPWRNPSGTCSRRQGTGQHPNQQCRKQWRTQSCRKLQRTMQFKMQWNKQKTKSMNYKTTLRIKWVDDTLCSSINSLQVTRATVSTSGSPGFIYIVVNKRVN